MTTHPARPDDAGAPPARPTPQTVLERQVYRGRNIYGYEPMIRIQLDLRSLEQLPTSALPGFTDRLLELLPSLYNHGSYREPGSFIRRLREGTWLGHITEHVALELQTLSGPRITYGKTRSVRERPGVYNLLYSYSYREERVSLLAGATALRLVDSLLRPDFSALDLAAPFDFTAELGELRRQARRHILGPTTQSLVSEAERRGIPHLRLDDHSLMQLGYGRYQQQVRASITGKTPYIAAVVAVAERVPAHVVGNGARTVAQLVDEANLDPRRGDGHEQVMTRIKIDAHVLVLLTASGCIPDSVPGAGEVVFLRDHVRSLVLSAFPNKLAQ